VLAVKAGAGILLLFHRCLGRKMAMLVSRGAKRLISSTVEDFYKLSAIALDGQEINFSKYKGKVVLIQNTASL
jgi:hypothetical protein